MALEDAHLRSLSSTSICMAVSQLAVTVAAFHHTNLHTGRACTPYRLVAGVARGRALGMAVQGACSRLQSEHRRQ